LGLSEFKGVDIYIFDTGLMVDHDEFQGHQAKKHSPSRVVDGRNFVTNAGGKRDYGDCHGHGTHVGAVAAGRNIGVATGAQLIAVRVLGCDGKGKVADLIQGIEWAVARVEKV
jgi:subtilisin family serine protease